MENTGRIRRPLASLARRIVFGRNDSLLITDEVSYICKVDRAHLGNVSCSHCCLSFRRLGLGLRSVLKHRALPVLFVYDLPGSAV
jgi:hypothetical protein